MTNWDDLTSDAALKGRLEAPACNVFDEATFTETGMQIISDTHSLQGIAERNAAKPDSVYVNFEYSTSS